MQPIIKLKRENIRIMIDTEQEIQHKHNISTRGAIIKCIKHVYRHSKIEMTKDIMVRILWLAHKGEECERYHMDVAQRDALYEYFEDKEVKDPYIKQFLIDTKKLLRK